VLLAWTAFTLIMYSFPPEQPVTAGNMNYVCVVYAVVLGVVVSYWWSRGEKTYRSRDERHCEAEILEDDSDR
jgi:choline transport protein